MTAKDTIDSLDRLKEVVKNIYRCGSDNRQQKNGGHEKLYQSIAESKHGVRTCGVDGKLPKHLQIFLDTKKIDRSSVDCKDLNESKAIRQIATIIKKLYDDKDTSVFISISNTGMAYLQKILAGEELSAKEYKQYFNLWGKYGAITQQEKNKNRPGKQKY
jgi:hypothetical protein